MEIGGGKTEMELRLDVRDYIREVSTHVFASNLHRRIRILEGKDQGTWVRIAHIEGGMYTDFTADCSPGVEYKLILPVVAGNIRIVISGWMILNGWVKPQDQEIVTGRI